MSLIEEGKEYNEEEDEQIEWEIEIEDDGELYTIK